MSEHICGCGFLMNEMFGTNLLLECPICLESKELKDFTIISSSDKTIDNFDKAYIEISLAPFDRTNIMVDKQCD